MQFREVQRSSEVENVEEVIVMDINSIVITSVVAISLIEDDYQKIDPALHTLYTFNVGGNIFSPGRRRQP